MAGTSGPGRPVGFRNKTLRNKRSTSKSKLARGCVSEKQEKAGEGTTDLARGVKELC